MNWLHTAIKVAETGGTAVLITVADVKGSSPREAGAKMLVLADTTIGTIGGGALELDAVKTARQKLLSDEETTQLKDYPLGPSLEQCCGGFVQLVFEGINHGSLNWLKAWHHASTDSNTTLFLTTIGNGEKQISTEQTIKTSNTILLDNVLHEHVTDDRQALWIFGAGHVTRAVINTLTPLNFAITVVDQRAEFLAELAGKQVTTRHNDVACREVKHAPSGSMVLVMTHSHAQDFDICMKALVRGDLGFVGLIGSATKRARFIKRLREKGLNENTISKLTCPIGLGNIRDKNPEAIAISVAAQLLSLRSQMSVEANSSNKILVK